MATYTETVTMSTQTCIKRGMLFAMEEVMDDRFRENHKQFCCPRGHKHLRKRTVTIQVREEKK